MMVAAYRASKKSGQVAVFAACKIALINGVGSCVFEVGPRAQRSMLCGLCAHMQEFLARGAPLLNHRASDGPADVAPRALFEGESENYSIISLARASKVN